MAEIHDLLSRYPRGLSIKEISQKLRRHRNSVSRDLQVLLLSGQVLQQAFGITRVYSLAQRTPVSRILHYTSDMVLIVDHSGTMIDANTPFLTFLSCRFDELEGKNINSEEHPLFCAIKTCSAGDFPPGTSLSATYQVSTENRVCHLKIKKINTVFEDGAPGFVFIIEDVTSEIISRDALKRSESNYRAVVETFPGMVIRFLPDGTITFANQAFLSYFHSSSGEIRDGTFFSLVNTGDLEMLRSHLADLSPEYPSASLSLRVIPAGGSPVWTTWTIHAIYEEEHGLIVYQATGRDISPEIDAKEREIENSRELAFLTIKSRDFLTMDQDTDIYSCIARHLREMIPRAAVAVYAIDPMGKKFTIKSLIREDNPLERGRVLKQDCIDLTCSLAEEETQTDEIKEALSSGSLADIGGYLYHCLIRQSIHGGFERAKVDINGKQACSAGLVWNGSLIGAVEIVTGTDSAPINRAFIETYLNMASLALQRRESEQALNLSEERFRRITAINPLPISIIDQLGRYTYLSPHFTEIFGYTLEDIPTGKEWFMYAFPNLAEQKIARETWKQDLADSVPGVIRPREFRVRCKDGLFKVILFLPVSMSDGQQLIVYEDVSPRLEAIQTRNLLFDIFRSSHDGILSTTINGRILSWNPAAERIYGYTLEEVTGKDVRIIEPPSLKGEISSILEQVNRGECITDYETKRMRKDGRLIDVSLTISPVYRDGDTITGVSTIVRDITSHKAEERLRDAETRYQDLVNNINVGVYRSTGDPEGKFIWGNTSLLRILGYDSMDELQGIAVSDIFAHSGGRAELLGELRKNGFVKNREIILRRGDGTAAHVLVTALATFSTDGSISYINGIVEDVTGQRLLEQKVARLTRNRKKA
jgi:PAS domain S-box-containing protein